MYRITTNGIKFRIEKLVTFKFLFFKSSKWKPLGSYSMFEDWQEDHYNTLRSAQVVLNEIVIREQQQEAARKHGWVSVS